MNTPRYAASLVPPTPQNQGPRSGALYLRESIKSYFESYSVDCEVSKVGLKYRSYNKTDSPNRVVIIPGDFDGESMRARQYGTITKEIQNASGVNPRELAMWARILTISIWAKQPATEQDASAALEEAENLLEQVIRALHHTKVNGRSVSASYQPGDVIDNSPPVEAAYGAELLLKIRQDSPILDVALDVAFPRPVNPTITSG